MMAVKLYVVSKGGNGFSMAAMTVPSLDMRHIAKELSQMGWSVNTDDCEIFREVKGTVYWVARRTGRGWTRIATNVGGWEKYASPSWVKKANEANSAIMRRK